MDQQWRSACQNRCVVKLPTVLANKLREALSCSHATSQVVTCGWSCTHRMIATETVFSLFDFNDNPAVHSVMWQLLISVLSGFVSSKKANVKIVQWDIRACNMVERTEVEGKIYRHYPGILTLILRRSRTRTVWFYISTSNKRAARPKLYTKSLTRDLKLMYSRFTLVRISINL